MRLREGSAAGNPDRIGITEAAPHRGTLAGGDVDRYLDLAFEGRVLASTALMRCISA